MPESMPNNDPDITVTDAFDDEADAPVPNSEEAEYRAGYSVILEQVEPFWPTSRTASAKTAACACLPV